MTPPPPRSVLYVPAARPGVLAKIRALPADAFVVDLEDGVGPGHKAAARDAVRRAHEDGTLAAGVPWMLRVNPAGTPEHDADLALVAETNPLRVVLPKVERAADVVAAGDAAAAARAALALTLETAAGIGRARELAGAHPRVDMLLLGSADLRRSLGAPADPDRGWERHALAELLLAARMANASAIDGVYFHFRDGDGLRRHAAVARALGYDGKSCIHPAQIDPIHDAFRSTAKEADWARRVLRAWDARAVDAAGVVVVDDEMIEALHVTVAQRILRRA